MVGRPSVSAKMSFGSEPMMIGSLPPGERALLNLQGPRAGTKGQGPDLSKDKRWPRSSLVSMLKKSSS
jgi:hypothetical protein